MEAKASTAVSIEAMRKRRWIDFGFIAAFRNRWTPGRPMRPPISRCAGLPSRLFPGMRMKLFSLSALPSTTAWRHLRPRGPLASFARSTCCNTGRVAACERSAYAPPRALGLETGSVAGALTAAAPLTFDLSGYLGGLIIKRALIDLTSGCQCEGSHAYIGNLTGQDKEGPLNSAAGSQARVPARSSLCRSSP
jgi:hypothetical protein